MKNLIGFLFTAFFLLFSCQTDFEREDMNAENDALHLAAIYAPLIMYDSDCQSVNSQLRRGDLVERPIKFRSEGTLTIIFQSPECGGNNRTLVEGIGHGSHMGKIAIHLNYCWHLADPTDPFSVVLDSYVTGTVVAANGDEIQVVLIGAGTDEKGDYQNYLIVGGTGRFTGATGHYTLWGVIDYVNGVYWHEGGGVIAY
jgi:hypothetical protein